MDPQENEDEQPCHLRLNDGEEVGHCGEDARGGRPLGEASDDRAHHLSSDQCRR